MAGAGSTESLSPGCFELAQLHSLYMQFEIHSLRRGTIEVCLRGARRYDME